MAKLFKHKLLTGIVSGAAGKYLDFMRKRLWTVDEVVTPPETQALFDARESVIYALWHGRMYSLLRGVPEDRTAILISASNDGDFIADAARHMGFKHFARGSHKRQGRTAVREMIELLTEQGNSIAFTVDGPRGPRYKVKTGIIKLCAQAQRPIVPMASATKHMLKKFESSWDHYHAALVFFNSIRLVYGKPIQVPEDPSEEQIEEYRQKLEDEIMRLNLHADSLYGFGDEWL